MLERHDADVAAKFRKHRSVSLPDAIFGECDQINIVLAAKSFQQMKGAIVRAAIHGIRDIRINSENVHQLNRFQSFRYGSINPERVVAFVNNSVCTLHRHAGSVSGLGVQSKSASEFNNRSRGYLREIPRAPK